MSAPPAGAPAPPPELLARLAGPPGRALMLGHVFPDADVLGTLFGLGLALEGRGWSVDYAGPHPVPRVLDFLPGASRYRTPASLVGRWDAVVLTDCPNPDRTEGLLEAARSRSDAVVNIDHHPDNRRYGDVNWIDPAAAATGEMIFDLLERLGVPLDSAIATNLLTAVVTDTGSFRYSNVTARTFAIASALTAAGARPAEVAGQLHERREAEDLERLGRMLSRTAYAAVGRIGYLALEAGVVPEAFLAAEELVNYPRSVAGVEVAILFTERPGEVKVSLRAKGTVDVARIAGAFGGGGHRNAAGCSVAGTLAEVRARVVAAVEGALAVSSATSQAVSSATSQAVGSATLRAGTGPA